MVAGHLQEKKGYYYAVLSYKDADKRRRTKWIASGLPVKGNKKKAEGFLQEQRRSFEIPLADQPIAKDGQELFADYLQRWLQVAKTTVAPTTYGSYGGLLRNPIDPWFRKKRITLQGLTASDLQAFYMEQGEAREAEHSHSLPCCDSSSAQICCQDGFDFCESGG